MEYVKGCGKEAEIETNEKGGKQSTTAYSLHLIGGKFISAIRPYQYVFNSIGRFMQTEDKGFLIDIIRDVENREFNDWLDIFLRIGEVLKEGAKKYKINNWRLIPQEEHINHAMIHYIAYTRGDKQDDHLGHFITRLMMAYETEKSEKFSYTEYIA